MFYLKAGFEETNSSRVSLAQILSCTINDPVILSERYVTSIVTEGSIRGDLDLQHWPLTLTQSGGEQK